MEARHDQPQDHVPGDEDECLPDAADLSDLARALRAGSKFRRLVLVCPRQHQAAAVYGTTSGPVLVAVVATGSLEVRGWYLQTDDEEFTFVRNGPALSPRTRDKLTSEHHEESRAHLQARGRTIAVPVEGPGTIEVVCRCGRHDVSLDRVKSLLETGKRRAVVG